MESTLQRPALVAAKTTPKAKTIVYWIVTALFCLPIQHRCEGRRLARFHRHAHLEQAAIRRNCNTRGVRGPRWSGTKKSLEALGPPAPFPFFFMFRKGGNLSRVRKPRPNDGRA